MRRVGLDVQKKKCKSLQLLMLEGAFSLGQIIIIFYHQVFLVSHS